MLNFIGFEVIVEYKDNSKYILTAVTEEGQTAHPVQASCQLEEEEQEGGNLVMTGFLEDKRVIANITTVGDKLYVFTNVSVK